MFPEKCETPEHFVQTTTILNWTK